MIFNSVNAPLLSCGSRDSLLYSQDGGNNIQDLVWFGTHRACIGVTLRNIHSNGIGNKIICSKDHDSVYDVCSSSGYVKDAEKNIKHVAILKDGSNHNNIIRVAFDFQ